MKKTSILLASVASFVMGSTAFAQDAAESAEAEAASEGEIIVTAQRRSESLQKVPVSVTALTSETLENRNLNDLQQITLAAPSLQIGQDNTFAVRGVGTQSFAQTIDSSVALAVDEVNYASTFLGGAKFNDVAQVEVLNGPQGLLFGKNASAGLLNIVTRRPVIGEFGGAFDAEYSLRDTTPGNGDGVNAFATINVPVSSNSALRVNGTYSYQEPVARVIGRRSVNRLDQNARQYGVKAKYLLEASDALSLYLIADYNEEHGTAGIFDRTYLSIATGSNKAATVGADGVTAGPENLFYGNDGGAFRDLKTGGAQAKISYELSNGWEISNITAWRFYKLHQQLDVDFTSTNDLNTNKTVTDYDQYSNELRLAIPESERLNGQIGLYYSRLDQNTTRSLGGLVGFPAFVAQGFPFCVNATVNPGPPPNCSVSNAFFLGSDAAYIRKNESYAAFGQFNFRVTDALQLLAGARVTRDEISLDLQQNRMNYFVALGPRNQTVRQSNGNTNFSWKVGAQYEVTPNIMLYGTYSRGYKGPGYNDSLAFAGQDPYIEPETVDSFELGMKSSFFDRALTFNLSLFSQKFKNYQAQSFDLANQSFIVQNAATLNSKGAEVTVFARPFDGFTINGSATFLDSKFGSFPGAQCYPGQPNCPTGSFNAGGLNTPLSAKFTSSVQAMYEVGLADDLTGFIEANYYHRSAINFRINRAPGTGQAPIDLLGASIGVRTDSGMKFSIFCKNCTDKKVNSFIDLDAGDSTVGLQTYIGAWGFNSVRTIGLNFGMDF